MESLPQLVRKCSNNFRFFLVLHMQVQGEKSTSKKKDEENKNKVVNTEESFDED